jgi:hypothetical protein
VYLVEYRLVGAEEAPLDVPAAETDVEGLAVCLWVGVVAVRTVLAAEGEALGDLDEVLAHGNGQYEEEHWKKKRKHKSGQKGATLKLVCDVEKRKYVHSLKLKTGTIWATFVQLQDLSSNWTKIWNVEWSSLLANRSLVDFDHHAVVRRCLSILNLLSSISNLLYYVSSLLWNDTLFIVPKSKYKLKYFDHDKENNFCCRLIIILMI